MPCRVVAVEPRLQVHTVLHDRVELQFIQAAARWVRSQGEFLTQRADRRQDFGLSAADHSTDTEEELTELPIRDRSRLIELPNRVTLRLHPGQGWVVALQDLDVGAIQLMHLP